MPQEYRDYRKQWVDLNPGWEVLLWDLIDATNICSDGGLEVIDHIRFRDAGRKGIESFVQIADVFAYEVVAAYGGVYVNCDMQPLKPIESFIPDKAWASYENDIGDVVNSAFGSPVEEDPFWETLVARLPERYFASPTAEMVKTTGPGLLTDHYRDNPDLLHVFPKEYFNPVHWSKVPPGGDASAQALPDTAIAVHHWGHKKDKRTNYVESGTQR